MLDKCKHCGFDAEYDYYGEQLCQTCYDLMLEYNLDYNKKGAEMQAPED